MAVKLYRSLGSVILKFSMRSFRTSAIIATHTCRRERDLNTQDDKIPRRNKGFEATLQDIISAAVRLISDKGIEALSMAAISRAIDINRTTLYYHFADREALVLGVKHWASEQLAQGFSPVLPREERADHIIRFVLENGALIKMFIEDFLSPGDIRDRYPKWDALVEGITRDLPSGVHDPIDPEVYCVMMLTSAFIAPRIFQNSVRSDLPLEQVIVRFRREQMRVLKRDGLGKSAAI